MSKSISSTAQARPRIRGIEIFLYVLLAIFLSLLFTYHESARPWFFMVTIMTEMIYFFGGYFFIIKIKGFLLANITAALTSILFTLALFFATRKLRWPSSEEEIYFYFSHLN